MFVDRGGCPSLDSLEYHCLREIAQKDSGWEAIGLDLIARALQAPQTLDLAAISILPGVYNFLEALNCSSH